MVSYTANTPQGEGLVLLFKGLLVGVLIIRVPLLGVYVGAFKYIGTTDFGAYHIQIQELLWAVWSPQGVGQGRLPSSSLLLMGVVGCP